VGSVAAAPPVPGSGVHEPGRVSPKGDVEMIEEFLDAAEVERLKNLTVPARLPGSFPADEPEPVPDAMAVGAAILALSAGRFELAESVRRCARNGLDAGMSPDAIRGHVLSGLGPIDPEPIANIEATVKAALDGVLGPEVEGV
jgi:hypothetical protein